MGPNTDLYWNLKHLREITLEWGSVTGSIAIEMSDKSKTYNLPNIMMVIILIIS